MAEDPRLFCLHFISHWTESLVRSRYVLRAQKYHVMVLMGSLPRLHPGTRRGGYHSRRARNQHLFFPVFPEFHTPRRNSDSTTLTRHVHPTSTLPTHSLTLRCTLPGLRVLSLVVRSVDGRLTPRTQHRAGVVEAAARAAPTCLTHAARAPPSFSFTTTQEQAGGGCTEECCTQETKTPSS